MEGSVRQIRNTFENRGDVRNQVGQQNIYGNLYLQRVRDNDDSQLLKLPCAEQAAFNASIRQHDALCLFDTRVDVLRRITAWADGSREKCIFWVNGMAGTGKSTIARTIARRYHEWERLGASFFFSRGGGDLGHAGKFFTTIATQLANQSPALKGYIREAVANHEDIAHQALRDQWTQLVLGLLLKLTADSPLPPLILVVDALDECEGEDDVRTILQLLGEARGVGEMRLRVLVTSRPKTLICFGFEDVPCGDHHDFILHNISQSIIEHDLTVFFTHGLKSIRRERGFPSHWPSDQTIQVLVQKAGGLFIWAATACLFIRDGKSLAQKRLLLILEGDTSGMPTESKLDEIYLTILKDWIHGSYDEGEKDGLCEMFRHVIGSIVITFEALCASTLAKLLEILADGVNQTLHDLHSVVEISMDQEQSSACSTRPSAIFS